MTKIDYEVSSGNVFEDLELREPKLRAELAKILSGLQSKEGSIYRDKNGNNISLLEWCALRQDESYSKIAQEMVGDYFVSSVWVGMLPVNKERLEVFETMVFDKEHNDIDVKRYETEEECMRGHQEMVEKYRKC